MRLRFSGPDLFCRYRRPIQRLDADPRDTVVVPASFHESSLKMSKKKSKNMLYVHTQLG